MRRAVIYVAAAVAAGPSPAPRADGLTELLAAGIEAPDDPQILKALEEDLPAITHPFNPSVRFMVVEGDVRIRDDALADYLENLGRQSRVASEVDQLESEGHVVLESLINVRDDGEPDVWPKNNRTLQYAVLEDTFSTRGRYEAIVSNIAAASETWERACSPAAIEYEHVPEFDGLTDTAETLAALESGMLDFLVLQFDSGGAFIASAFFPHTPASDRLLLIDPSYFGELTYSGEGVMKHELGHVHGLRHEHTARLVPGCEYEDNKWIALTGYDRLSLMHYLCGGGGTHELMLTEKDKGGFCYAYRSF